MTTSPPNHPTLTPQKFVARWRQSTLKESAGAQQHFIDLCRLVGHPAPAEADPYRPDLHLRDVSLSLVTRPGASG